MRTKTCSIEVFMFINGIRNFVHLLRTIRCSIFNKQIRIKFGLVFIRYGLVSDPNLFCLSDHLALGNIVPFFFKSTAHLPKI